MKPTVDLKLRAYGIVSEAVDAGIQIGIARAHKHTATPLQIEIHEAVMHGVMCELCDVIDFGD